MAIIIETYIYLFLLTYSLYFLMKTAESYSKTRSSTQLAILAFLLLFSTQLWFAFYGGSINDLFQKYSMIITFIPLILFMAYDKIEEKRRKEQEEKNKIKGMFEKYVNPNIIKKIIKQKKLKLGGERQEITILFSDVRGFTSLSEKTPPEKVVKMLNEYFNIATRIIQKHDGTVDKFIGDAVMAIFNAPIKSESHADNAVQTAIEMQKEFKKKNLSVGIGINTGDAVIGNIGSSKVMDYTAIGDAVNTASRIQGLAKAGEIAITDSTFKKIKTKAKAIKRQETVKGKEKPITIHVIQT
ncbi:MAG: adenylate/guanylate cyclase domain-containing protein [Candidatus Marsarchaeota archaeon]|nr:adenylate/guanylate cyclase domain-containing protein [Candidatus Marsarchaeota archaeon]